MIIKGTAPRENPPAGSHIGRCIKLIDLGTQVVEWQGTTKHQRKVVIGFELTLAPMAGLYQPELKGKPFGISRRFTMSLLKNSALKAFLEGWRGRAFSKEELVAFDISKLLGMPCFLNLVENGEYVNLACATQIPNGVTAPKAISKLVKFSLQPDEFDPKTFGELGEYYQDLISKSPEYQALFNSQPQADEEPEISSEEGGENFS